MNRRPVEIDDQSRPIGSPRVAVIGLGYVGLSTAACLGLKFPVAGIDVDPRRVELVNRGEAPFMETGLSSLLEDHARTGMLKCSTIYQPVRDAQIVFMTVGTPSGPSGEVDLSYVKAASESLGKAIRESELKPVIVVKSTVTPGTSRQVVTEILEQFSGKKCGVDFGVCSNPEFLREGQAIEDTLHPSRIVIGPVDQMSRRIIVGFYNEFYGETMPPVVETSAETAELIKYASNAFLAAKISFINIIARMCEKLPECDVKDVAKGMGLDPRIGPLFLQAGPGFGGSCFPKDVQALGSFARTLDVDASLLDAILRINETQPERVAFRAEEMLGGNVRDKKIAVLGVAFNPDTDDIRESRAIPLIRLLVGNGATVGIHDPMAMEAAKREFGDSVSYHPSVTACVKGSDLVIVMTAWKNFEVLGEDDLKDLMAGKPRLLDARRVFDPSRFREVEFAGTGLGRPLPATSKTTEPPMRSQ